MREFFQEPLAPTLVCAIVANLVWLCMWLAMWSTGRFQKSIGRGIPILVGIGLFNVPFGFLFLGVTVIGLVVLSVFWLYASVTNTFENERMAIANFLHPVVEEKEEEEAKKAEEEKGEEPEKKPSKKSAKKSSKE